MAKEQRTVWFSGLVQGVGFRFTACRIADGYKIGGYVRNLPDERVECAAEGETDQLDAFFEELVSSMSAYIRKRTQQTAPYTGRMGSFTVRY